MPIEPPRLDDITFDRTVEELIRRIPVYAPEWTDHNASDPGIAFIHLVACVAEQVDYRLNRLPRRTTSSCSSCWASVCNPRVRREPARAAHEQSVDRRRLHACRRA